MAGVNNPGFLSFRYEPEHVAVADPVPREQRDSP